MTANLKRVHDNHVLNTGAYTENVEYLTSEKGSVQVTFCSTCGLMTTFMCECSKNTWYTTEGKPVKGGSSDSGVTLRCDLCGRDNT